jgi:hypothetical protein
MPHWELTGHKAIFIHDEDNHRRTKMYSVIDDMLPGVFDSDGAINMVLSSPTDNDFQQLVLEVKAILPEEFQDYNISYLRYFDYKAFEYWDLKGPVTDGIYVWYEWRTFCRFKDADQHLIFKLMI